MNEPIYPEKKPNGCWKTSGCLLTIVSALLIAFCVYMIFYSEKRMDENRAEYAASMDEYEEALMAYEADSAHLRAEYLRIQAEIEAAIERQDSTETIMALMDSLNLYAEPEYNPRGHVGFNIAGGFFVFFILFLLIPLGIGLFMLLYYRYKQRKWLNNERMMMNN